ncbi:Tryptophan synthase alpha chain [Serratia symbiotica]|nr:Tryptophan synthase alpha chain [Serratia symbiotica]
MDRYKKLFENLKNKKEGAFIPFVMLGDPNITVSLELIDVLIESGSDALELGFPFSDPLADGLIIQNSSYRALKIGITPIKCFQLLQIIRKKYPTIPIGLLIYANLVFNYGIHEFYKTCYNIGIDSVLIADIPFEESKPFRFSANNYNISPIFICPPNADENLIKNISIYSHSYVYLLSRAGVTGIENFIKFPLENIIKKFKKYNSFPLIQGFGISKSSQIKNILKSGVSGVISGSAIINIIEKNFSTPTKMLNKISIFIRNMKNSTKL